MMRIFGLEIEWPWTRMQRDMEYRIQRLEEEKTALEDSLTDARVLNFIRIREYRAGEQLSYKDTPKISLPDLLARIETLEKQAGCQHEWILRTDDFGHRCKACSVVRKLPVVVTS